MAIILASNFKFIIYFTSLKGISHPEFCKLDLLVNLGHKRHASQPYYFQQVTVKHCKIHLAMPKWAKKRQLEVNFVIQKPRFQGTGRGKFLSVWA